MSINTSDITVGDGKTLNVSGGTFCLADDQISGDRLKEEQLMLLQSILLLQQLEILQMLILLLLTQQI